MKQKVGRFEGIDFSNYEVTEATPDLMETLGEGFRCKRREFVTYWRRGRIIREAQSHLCRCWVVQHEQYMVGYITLLADKLVLQEPMLANEGVAYQTFPAIKIGLLATDLRTSGVGRCLIEWAMEYVATEVIQKVGVRFMTVDAFYDKDDVPIYDASGFYENFGFQFVNPDEQMPPENGYRTMYFDLKPLIDIVNNPDPVEE